jgi:hypothetical protein
MSGNGRAPEPTELVYVPEPSWTPAFVAFGLAGILVGIFAGWVWMAAGAFLGLLALRKWIGDVADDLRRLPRRQDLTTATLPATPMRSARRS